MKLYKSIIFVIICSLGSLVSGCSDWLDYTPKDKQTSKQQFSTREGFYNAVNGIYVKMSGSSLYGYNLSYGPIDIMGQCYKVSNSNKTLDELKTYTWNGENASKIFTAIWTNAYSCILNINLLLQELENAHGTVLRETDYKLIKGEMLALRSFLHFDLLRIFGPVYLKTPAGLGVPFNDRTDAVKVPRMPADQMIKEQLIPDLTQAQDLLVQVDPVITNGVLNSDGGEEGNLLRYRQLRMNYYATTLVKARVCLWIKDYDNALLESKKITDNETVKQWFPFVESGKLLANKMNPDRMFSTECLFGFYNNTIADIYMKRFSGALDVQTIWQPRNGYVSILFPNTNDYRYQSQWTGSSLVGGSQFDFIKYKSFVANKDNPEFWATFYGLMRISEAYYIAAESSLNKDNLDGARSYLTTISSARGISGPLATASKTSLLKTIKMEYLRETRGEGQIFFLLKRFYQGFSMFDDGGSSFNGAVEADLSFDSPSIARYVIPIPEGENY